MESNTKFNQWLLFNIIHIGLSLYAFVSYNVHFSKSPEICNLISILEVMFICFICKLNVSSLKLFYKL